MAQDYEKCSECGGDLPKLSEPRRIAEPCQVCIWKNAGSTKVEKKVSAEVVDAGVLEQLAVRVSALESALASMDGRVDVVERAVGVKV